jgi:hypothetical protein
MFTYRTVINLAAINLAAINLAAINLAAINLAVINFLRSSTISVASPSRSLGLCVGFLRR